MHKMDIFSKLRHICTTNHNNSEVIHVERYFGGSEVQFRLECTIKNLSQYCRPGDTATVMHSAGVTMSRLGLPQFKGRWRILIFPTRKIPAKDTGMEMAYLGAALQLTDDEGNAHKFTGDEQWDVKFQIGLCTGKWRKRFVSGMVAWKGVAQFDAFQSVHGYRALCHHACLFGTADKPGVLKDDTITIITKVVIHPKSVRIASISDLFKGLPALTVDAAGKPVQHRLCVAGQSVTICPSCDCDDFNVDRVAASLVLAILLSGDSMATTTDNGEMKDVKILISFLRNCHTGQFDKETINKVQEIISMHREDLHSFYGKRVPAGRFTLQPKEYPVGEWNVAARAHLFSLTPLLL